ncbi:hypothetical protein [Archangium primigenium]|uniref:hypothetical protein n=1 Tax=[Archangium] primigenium TaxID=2792470 RepID=UPI00195A8F36|nr:hypothetical protein [Archangium primigenium]MBM7112736.1 hypothetical protein [Archangium primigenium]
MNAPDPLAPVDPLHSLCERVRAPDAGPEDLRSLLAECTRPLLPHEDTAARARALGLLLEDPFVGGLRDARHRRVDETAARALVALGEPHLQALSPEARRVLDQLEVKPSAPPPPEPGAPRAWPQHLALGVLAWGAIEALCASGLIVSWNTESALFGGVLVLLALVLVGVTLGVPCDILLSRQRRFSPFAYLAAAVDAAGSGLLMLSVSDFGLAFTQYDPTEGTYLEQHGVGLFLLASGVVRLTLAPALSAAFRARPPPREKSAPAP